MKKIKEFTEKYQKTSIVLCLTLVFIIVNILDKVSY